MDRRSAQTAPLYDPAYEHDACGVGLVVDIAGRPSREIVTKALAGLVNLTHRGGVGADARTGDGAGLMIQIPHALFAPALADAGQATLRTGDYGVAMVFLPSEPAARQDARAAVEAAAEARGLAPIAWREVPVRPEIVGESAAKTRPEIAQLLIARPDGMTVEAFERQLMLARRAAERAVDGDQFFIASCSARTLIYKGFCLPEDLAVFYEDLQNPNVVSAIALFHQRYSTNTFPTWGLAQPFRFLAHNGEINTVQGNRTWMRARMPELDLGDGVTAAQLAPVVSQSGSDSLSLDNVLEALYHGARSLPHALMMCVPEPWEQLPEMDPARHAFYDYHAGLMEQWDGPAALAFSDGVLAGATLDRNGLRPLRYAITEDGWFVAGSEAGTVEIDQTRIVEKGRLGPGQMILIDTARGVVLRNDELKAEVASNAPFEEWLEERIHLELVPEAPEPLPVPVEADAKTRLAATKVTPEVIAVQRAFGYTAEDIRLIVTPMAGEGKEPTWSMGDDAPLAVLSDVPRPLTAYFRQRFAQVTNPAIDSLREKKVMALDAFLGPRGNLFAATPEQARLLHLPSVVLSAADLAAIEAIDALTVRKIAVTFPVDQEENALARALNRILSEATAAVRNGAGILVLSDRGVDAGHAAVPMSLVVGAVHHHLIREGLRMRTDFVCETGEVWDIHQLCVLIGYGASAVYPYLAEDAAAALSATRGYEAVTPTELRHNYRYALENGFLKVSSKMGISTASGYRGAQIFEALGLSQELVEAHFTGTPSRLGGIGLPEIDADVRARHASAYAEMVAKLPDYGLVRYRKDGETHAYAPPVVTALQQAVQSKDAADYQAFRDLVKQQPLTAVRDLLTLKPIGPAVPLDEVEPATAITKRFVVTAMSLGALSPEAHSTLAIAMNRIGARSNSGEGGEDPHWYDAPGPDVPHNKVKQVASGRFGVTARYLSKAAELEIKISQGSKPGEGGQLPGHKVTEFVARLRHAVPGLPLISPPPHHDIYSIEDLAQLIYDLRQINPRARIGVKLVAEAGVGTVAAGVAKARADYILISGHSGGTGASPLASIKHAGCPWELGLAETQQTLVMNGLRSRVRLRTDGGIKTPEDVLMAAMFGAEEFGFGTSVLVSMGCDMARQCHLNTCPTGIATQRADLRAKFKGTPEDVIAWFDHLTTGIRALMASLGVRTIDELVGRTDLLGLKEVEGRAAMLNLSGLLATPADERARRKTLEIDHHADETLDDRILRAIEPALKDRQPVTVSQTITTSDRTAGAKIAGHMTVMRDANPTPLDRVTCHFTGSAGQSFGAFAVPGLTLTLEGEANDYVGKGMTGGEIAIFPPRRSVFATPQAIAGNTILYGATGGHLFLAGRAGERFAVRNSGAQAVVEGVGDHGCEYMTGGVAVILGPTGRNFGAGMTNGVAYVYDEPGTFAERINGESIQLRRLEADEERELRALIERHVELTGSAHAREILATWPERVQSFWRVVPTAALALAAQEVAAENDVQQGAAD